MKAGRVAAAVAVTVVAGPIGVWTALIALISIISQLLAGFGVIINANWVNLFNPAVWFGFNNVAGTGSIGDSLVAGPGAPGGSVNRYVLFMVTGIAAAACFAALRSVWRWAREDASDG